MMNHPDLTTTKPVKPLDASIVFLGTCSMRPSPTRNVSGNAIRIGREWTIVDCGEGTQHQILKCASHPTCSRISPGNITRILITHLHGDHCFGLPGLMCLIDNAVAAMVKDPSTRTTNGDGSNSSASKRKRTKCPKESIDDGGDDDYGGQDSNENVVHIVGPRGLRNMIRAILLSSCTGISFRFRVDELWTERDVRQHQGMQQQSSNGGAHFATVFGLANHPSEIAGVDVLPNSDSTWTIPTHPAGGPMAASWKMFAAPLQHTIDSVGYVFVEGPQRGTLNVTQALRDRLLTDENKVYQKTMGVSNPLQLLGFLQKGESASIKEGGIIVELNPGEYVSPPAPGRKLVVLGDTCDSRRLAGLAANADMIVHEATNAAIEEGETRDAVLRLAVSRGHSTPEMAGAFAQACGAKQLVLTHFSSRYKGDESAESVAIMNQIVKQATETFGGKSVLAAKDLMEIKLISQKGARDMVDPSKALEDSAAAADAYLRRAGFM